MADNCIFCKIIAGEIPSNKVYEDDQIYAFRDINPAAPTHVLIIPKKHIAYVSEMQPEDKALIGHLIYSAARIAEQEGITNGFRLVVNNGADAGQAVFHIHYHLLGGRKMTWPPG